MCVHSRKAFASANCNYLLGKVSAYLSSQSEKKRTVKRIIRWDLRWQKQFWVECNSSYESTSSKNSRWRQNNTAAATTRLARLELEYECKFLIASTLCKLDKRRRKSENKKTSSRSCCSVVWEIKSVLCMWNSSHIHNVEHFHFGGNNKQTLGQIQRRSWCVAKESESDQTCERHNW